MLLLHRTITPRLTVKSVDKRGRTGTMMTFSFSLCCTEIPVSCKFTHLKLTKKKNYSICTWNFDMTNLICSIWKMSNIPVKKGFFYLSTRSVITFVTNYDEKYLYKTKLVRSKKSCFLWTATTVWIFHNHRRCARKAPGNLLFDRSVLTTTYGIRVKGENSIDKSQRAIVYPGIFFLPTPAPKKSELLL